MLKLTNSFYRYFMITCEKLNYKSHVKKCSQLSFIRERCKADCVEIELKRQISSSQALKKYGNNKKRLSVKIPPLNLNDSYKTEQMSESQEPTSNHVSYGGTFEVSHNENNSVQNWRKSSELSDNCKQRQIPPGFREWENVGNKCDSTNGTFKFKVVSYNVLAQYLLECHPYLYTDCSPQDLKWKVRSERLYNEIISLAPDILCLQEVQVSHLISFYSKFEEIGYSCVFKQKTGHRQDGCAIYYKDSLFEMKEYISVEFYQPELPLLNRDNIGVMVKLAPRCAPHNPIVVATTHLLYNPKRTDVRLAQIQVFLAEIDRFAFYTNGLQCGHLPIILTGDLNSTPESAVVKLLDNGYVSARSYRDSSDWQRIGVTDNCQHLSVYLNRQAGMHTEFNNVKIFNSDYSDTIPNSVNLSQVAPFETQFSQFFNSGNIYQSLQLASVYNKYKTDGRYEATTFQDYWVTVDYIYFSSRLVIASRTVRDAITKREHSLKKNVLYVRNVVGLKNRYNTNYLRLTDRLRLPTSEECNALNRLPNEVYASDHLALAAAFEIPIFGRAAL